MKLPPIELLEAVHQFPGNYTFKIIAENEATIIERVVDQMKQICPRLKDVPYTSRLTENKKYLSITIDIVVESAQEIHTLYNSLLKVSGIVLML